MSITYLGLYAAVLGFLAERLHLSQSDLAITVATLVQVIGLGVAFYGRWRKGDVNIFGSRKSSY